MNLVLDFKLELGKVYSLSLKLQNIGLKLYFPAYYYFSIVLLLKPGLREL